MRNSKTLAKLRSNKLARLCGLGHFIPPYVRHAAHYGFDCIWLDLEHREMNYREVQTLLALCHQFDIDCMVRSPTLEKTRLYRYFEDGATGVMIPHVSTPQKAEELVQAVKFPPIGDRGLDGAGLDSDFLLQGGPDFPGQANRETFVVVQIESPLAVQNVDAIAAVEGIDVLFIGPADLSLRLKHSDQQDLTLETATTRVAEAAAKHGKAWGRPASSLEDLKLFYEQGARFLAHGGEYIALMKMLEECGGRFENVEAD